MSNTFASDGRYDETTPVLIVGGSLIGLSMSLFLAWRGVPSILVERHQGLAIHPRVASLTAGTMELFRQIGIESDIRRVEPPFPHDSSVPRAESLVGQDFDNVMEDMSAYFTDASPAQGSLIAQDVLEPLLLKHARDRGGDLRYATELMTFEQDTEGVTATVRDQASGDMRTIRSSFIIAADGSQSGVRKQLGIGQHGMGTIGFAVSTIFEADIEEFFRRKHAVMCIVNNETVPFGYFVPYGAAPERPAVYRLDFPYDPDVESLKDYPEERRLEMIRAAIGISDIPVKLRTALTWEMAVRVADRFQEGRVFLVGDAARVQPPTGALGGNTGIIEVNNLSWKLAAVLRGEADLLLLSTYDQERRPIADYTVEQVAKLSDERQGDDPGVISVDTLMVNLGYRYQAGAFAFNDGENDPPIQYPLKWRGQSGTRAPHLFLEWAGERISTLDLFGRHFVLLVGSEGHAWRDAAQSISEQLNLPMDIYQIGKELVDAENRFGTAYGVGPAGCSLVRPDGFVGWQAQAADEHPTSRLEQALAHVLCRSTVTL